jgi:hypothetical protein
VEAKSFAGQAETLLKLGTVALGVLYVLGVLISNIQLMEVGISDFASLRVRNVMTGFLFACYVVMLVLLLLPPIGAAYLVYVYGRSTKVRPYLIAVMTGLVGSLAVASILSAVVGYLFPWGQPWESNWDMSLRGLNELLNGSYMSGLENNWRVTYEQFADAFFHKKIMIGSLYLLSMVGAVMVLFAAHPRPRAWHAALYAAITLPVLALILVGFAHDVYPNIKYNLGGGQPDVAILDIRAEKEAASVSTKTSNPGASRDLREEIPVVIWYQSDKFLYISPIAKGDEASAKLVALDLALVRSIRYLTGYVRVSGGRSLSVVVTP